LIAIANQGRVLDGETTLGGYVPEAIYAAPSGDFNDITTGPANREGYSPGPGYDEITGRGSPKANLLVPFLVNYSPLFIPPLPPYPIHYGEISTGSIINGQISQNMAVPGNSLASQLDAGTSSELAGSAVLSLAPATVVSSQSAVGSSNSASLTSPENGSNAWSSTNGAQSASLGERSSLPLNCALVGRADDGSSADSNTDLNNGEVLQWAGLSAAVEILNA
jgi:hypothetical protein